MDIPNFEIDSPKPKTTKERDRDKPDLESFEGKSGLTTKPISYQSRISDYIPRASSQLHDKETFFPENLEVDDRDNEFLAPLTPKTSFPYTMSGVPVQFPFKAYQSQIQMMSKIIKALKESSNALLESPTGTGKSLALLCASLAWQKMIKEQIWERKKSKSDESNNEKKVDVAPLMTNPSLRNPMSPSMSLTSLPNDDDFNYTVKIHPPSLAQTSLQSSETIPPSRPKQTLPTKVPKIFYTSRTHKQITQVIKELKNNTVYRPAMTVLGSRNQYCIHKPVVQAVNKDEACRKHKDDRTCPYFDRARRLAMSNSIPEIWDIEDLKLVGKKDRGCPYYAARHMLDTAELIFCPYNYLIDPITRLAMDIDISDNIVIIDEGHNIEDVARDSATCEMNDKTFNSIREKLEEIQKLQLVDPSELDDFQPISKSIELVNVKELHHLIDTLVEFLMNNLNGFEEKDFEKQSKIVPPSTLVHHLALNNIHSTTMSVLLSEYKSLSTVNSTDIPEHIQRILFSPGYLLPLRQILLLLEFILEPRFTNDFHVGIIERVGRRKSDDWNCQLSIWCMNPAVTFSRLHEARSVILTSGTLSPMDSFASELQVNFPITLQADHILKPHQTWVGVLPRMGNVSFTGTYKFTETIAYQDQIGHAVLSIVKTVPNGVLLFVKSYDLIEKLVKRWERSGFLKQLEQVKPVFSEQRAQASFEKLLLDYYAKVNDSVHGEGNGALLIAVYRGKVSEGIDFSDHLARAVICVGIPFPSTRDLQVNLKREYNDAHAGKRNLLSGKVWYEIQAYRALNQALGRCLRHRNDWGALILLDDRFLSSSNQFFLSKWVHQRLEVFQDFNIAMISLQAYVQSNLARKSP